MPKEGAQNMSETGKAQQRAQEGAGTAAKSRKRSVQTIGTISFSAMLLLGVMVCAICDLAISGAFTWSLFPISSSVFAWLVFFPVVAFGAKGVGGSLLSCSVFILPFLAVLDSLVPSDLVLPIGTRVAVVSIAFLWGVFALFHFMRKRKLVAGALSLLLAIPVGALINLGLSKTISEPLIDVWDMVTYSVLATAAMVLFALEYSVRKKHS